MTENQVAIATEALGRAQAGQSLSNFPAIFQGFAEKGIAESDIEPRVNVLTYRAWQAKGRQVRRGEHGVKVSTFIPCKEKDPETGEETGNTFRRPKTATVFHVSQTDPS